MWCGDHAVIPSPGLIMIDYERIMKYFLLSNFLVLLYNQTYGGIWQNSVAQWSYFDRWYSITGLYKKNQFHGEYFHANMCEGVKFRHLIECHRTTLGDIWVHTFKREMFLPCWFWLLYHISRRQITSICLVSWLN